MAKSNLQVHLRAGFVGILVPGFLIAVAWWVTRIRMAWAQIAVSAASVGAISLLAWQASIDDWIEVGRSFSTVVLAYLGLQIFRKARNRQPGDEIWMIRTGFALLALMLLARMILNVRIYQFGFYQSALAGILFTCFLLIELPRMAGDSLVARGVVYASVLSMLCAGVTKLVIQNQWTHERISVPIGVGQDRFYVLPSVYVPALAELAELTTLLANQPDSETLLALPEGLMVNYLARKRSPLPHFFYYSVVTEHGGEEKVLSALRNRPPDWILLTPRNLREYGITEYGERVGAGALLLGFVRENYVPVAERDGAALNYSRHGIELLRRKR